MPKILLRCSKCERKFSMPAHLGRHMKAIHGSKGRTKSFRKTASSAKRPVGRPRAAGVKSARRPKVRYGVIRKSAAEATFVLLGDMQTYHDNLLSQRMSLDSQIDRLATAMTALSGAPKAVSTYKKTRMGRPKGSGGREGSLKNFIVRVLRQHTKPMRPSDIGARVVKAGFKTKAKDITKAVSNTIPELKNVKRVGFGLYKLVGR